MLQDKHVQNMIGDCMCVKSSRNRKASTFPNEMEGEIERASDLHGHNTGLTVDYTDQVICRGYWVQSKIGNYMNTNRD